MLEHPLGDQRRTSRCGTRARATAMYCDWPPSRCGGTTMRRAMMLVARGAELLAHDVQRRVDAGGGAGARDDLAVLDEEHVGVDVGPRVPLGEPVGVHPVGGRAAAVEDAGLAERERAAADAEHPGAACLGSRMTSRYALVDAARRSSGRARRSGRRRRRRRGPRATIDVEPELRARPGRGRRRRRGSRRSGPPLSRAVDAEHLADHAELERRHAAGGRCRRSSASMAILRWQECVDRWLLCHCRQDVASSRFCHDQS